ncbi:hypothetical protein [Sneathiella aquimaris]|uniref:hypothetical protein n=1 Tax=Sneathiella aquimaris TaxID=2599305 RepID=UPI001CA494CB|nr:hypothetical protein [Sneathiella aquimaris]
MRGPILTNNAQIASMTRMWPGLKRRGQRRGRIKWVGTVRPQFQTYRIEISHLVPKPPQVRVLSPELTRLPDNEEGQLPHVYPPADDPTLCLYDPANDEWDHSMLISETIVPWALDWLACYELWLMTGRWTGGGRHQEVGHNEELEVE